MFVNIMWSWRWFPWHRTPPPDHRAGEVTVTFLWAHFLFTPGIPFHTWHLTTDSFFRLHKGQVARRPAQGLLRSLEDRLCCLGGPGHPAIGGSGNSSWWLGFTQMSERTWNIQTTASLTILFSENKEENKAIKLWKAPDSLKSMLKQGNKKRGNSHDVFKITLVSFHLVFYWLSSWNSSHFHKE